MTRSLTALLALFLGACAAPEPRPPLPMPDAAERAQLDRPLICYGEKPCAAAWKRAMVWVSGNSKWKVRVATDSLIETFGPSRNDLDWAFQVIRKPGAQETEELVLTPACGSNEYRCRGFGGNPDKARASFNAYVRGE